VGTVPLGASIGFDAPISRLRSANLGGRDQATVKDAVKETAKEPGGRGIGLAPPSPPWLHDLEAMGPEELGDYPLDARIVT
jgi:hypothetical protein